MMNAFIRSSTWANRLHDAGYRVLSRSNTQTVSAGWGTAGRRLDLSRAVHQRAGAAVGERLEEQRVGDAAVENHGRLHALDQRRQASLQLPGSSRPEYA